MNPLAPFTPVDPAPWLGSLVERFGFQEEEFAAYDFFLPNDKYLYVAARGLSVPAAPTPERVGMAFLKLRMAHPKLTTQAALVFGPAARRNIISLSPDEADAYLHRTDLVLDVAQTTTCTTVGYVLVRQDHDTLGVGLYFPEGRRLRSLFPKVWAGVQMSP